MNKKRMNFMIPKSQVEILRARSISDGLTMSDIIRRALDLYFRETGNGEADKCNGEKVWQAKSD